MSSAFLTRVPAVSALRKYFGRPFLHVNERIWNHLPRSLLSLRVSHWYGRFLNKVVRLRSSRCQYHGTFFFRNRPELELIGRLANRKPRDASLNICVLACSNGAEVYSILWTIRKLRPDLNVVVQAVDISPEIVEIARRAVYSITAPQPVGSALFERITKEEMTEMFDCDDDRATIKPCLQAGITWRVGDAANPEIVNELGSQDIVVANKFLCHMKPHEAEKCLRNLSRLVRLGGYLLVSGVDLDVRTKVARALDWSPLPELLEEIHEGDPIMRHDWPWKYWGLEPLDKSRSEWKTRYAAAFRLQKQ